MNQHISPLDSISINDVIEAFEFLDSPDERIEYLIDLAKKVPPLPESEKTESNFVHGCQSQVWISMRMDADNKVQLLGDSDSVLVRGLVAVMLLLFSDKSPAEMLRVNAEDVFQKLNLDAHLSPNRRNGLRGMVDKIRQFAISHP